MPSCVITIYKNITEQGISESLAQENGISSINCTAVVSTLSLNIPKLTDFRIGCQNIYFIKGYSKPGTPNINPTASNGLVYSNYFKIAIIKFCGSDSYID